MAGESFGRTRQSERFRRGDPIYLVARRRPIVLEFGSGPGIKDGRSEGGRITDTHWIAAFLLVFGIALLALPIPASFLGAKRWILLVWRNRFSTAALVSSFIVAMHARYGPEEYDRFRDATMYSVVIAIGYGHFLGAIVFGGKRLKRFRPDGVSLGAFWTLVVSVFVGLAIFYGMVQGANQWLFIPMVALAAWHTVENDLALPSIYRSPRRTIGKLPRDPDYHVAAFGLTALIMSVAAVSVMPFDSTGSIDTNALTAQGSWALQLAAGAGGLWLLSRRHWSGLGALGALLLGMGFVDMGGWIQDSGLRFIDVFAGFGAYHQISFLVLYGDKTRATAAGPDSAMGSEIWKRIAWVHIPPLVFCAALFWWAYVDDAKAIHFIVFSPAVYMFWSSIHVLETVAGRGVEVQ